MVAQSMMKSRFKFFDSDRARKVLKIIMISLLFLYVFSIASFGEPKFKKFTFLNYGIYLIYISIVLLSATTLLALFVFKVKFKINRFSLIVPAFAMYALLGTLAYSKDIRGWATIVLLCITFFIFLFCFRIINNKHIVLITISAALFCFTLFYLAYYSKSIFDFKGFFSGKNRLGSEFDNQNGVAVFTVISFGISLYLFAFLKRKIRFIFLVPVLTSTWVGITTGSRTFIITAYVIAVIIFFFFFRKHKIIYLTSLLSLTIVALVVFNSLFENRLWTAIQTLFGIATKSDSATVSRELYLDYGVLLGSRNAIIGFGVNGFGIISGVGTYAHNNFAEVLCDFGVVGIILFYLPLLVFLIRSIRDKRIDKPFVFTFVVYYIVASFSNVIYYKKIYYVILALLFYLSFEQPFQSSSIPKTISLKRVLFTCDTMDSGGAEKVISVLANQMAVSGIKVRIIGVADCREPNSFYELNQDVIYDNLRKRNGKKLSHLNRSLALRRKIKEIQPDVVISFLPNANIYTWLSLVGLSIPHIVSERNNPYVDPKEKVIRLFKKLSFFFADRCVFQTNDAKNYYSKYINDKSVIIKNPITLKWIPSNNVANRSKTVLAVGRLTEQKNYKCLIDAFNIFNKSLDNSYILKIYGDGPLKTELESYCQSKELTQYVIFAGNDENWHEKEFNDSIYVLSSNYEGMPNALAEAMALGIPSISTDCPTYGSKELIEDGVNGMLVPINNPEELSRKMIELINKKDDFFYQNTRKMIEDYSPEKITNLWIRTIVNVLEGANEQYTFNWK